MEEGIKLPLREAWCCVRHLVICFKVPHHCTQRGFVSWLMCVCVCVFVVQKSQNCILKPENIKLIYKGLEGGKEKYIRNEFCS